MTNHDSNDLNYDRMRLHELACRSAARPIAEALQNGQCPADRAFDRFLPDELRIISEQYWTPLMVARRAAAWLDDLHVHTVVDIGSGAGKFCVAAALAGSCHFIGLEQRPQLVETARALARVFAVDDRVSFVEGVLGDIPTPVAEAYYLYNPFGEYMFGSTHRLEKVTVGRDRYDRDVAGVQRLLRNARVGTCVITYNGFGGQMPSGYRQLRVDRTMRNTLRLWRKEHKCGGDRRRAIRSIGSARAAPARRDGFDR